MHSHKSRTLTSNSAIARILAVLLLLGIAGGCAQYDNKRGVEVEWQPEAVNALVRGKSTRADVLKLLGPPSQVISLDDETVLYYLFEYSKGDGLILIVYNKFKVDTQYDRAIFFFDENDVLTDSATRIQGQNNS
jgi:outer membrane protein assembly factor BamE (lipoprotein component of BamABCDE complex)